MALVAGSVSVDGAGVVTGSGFALNLHTFAVADWAAAHPTLATPANLILIKQSIAEFINRFSTRIITYLLANIAAEVVVPTNAFGTGTPSAPVTLSVTIT